MTDLTVLEEEFKNNGRVELELLDKESSLLKKNIQLLLKIEKLAYKKGIGNILLKKMVMIQGMLASVRLSYLSRPASEVFDFFAINKNEIKCVEAKELSHNKVLFVFSKN